MMAREEVNRGSGDIDRGEIDRGDHQGRATICGAARGLASCVSWRLS